MSLLWTAAVDQDLTDAQRAALDKVRALPGEEREPNRASGEPVARLMAEHGITRHQIAPQDHEYYPSHETDWQTGVSQTGTIGRDVALHTSQGHLWKPALEHYIRHGNDAVSDPEHVDEHGQVGPYHPETYDFDDKTWIGEGHHRLLADRMLGKTHTTTYHGQVHDEPHEDWHADWKATH